MCRRWPLSSRSIQAWIRDNQVGVGVKRFSLRGKKLSEGRIIALNGEPGYQAATLGLGVHLWYFPLKYKIEKHPMTVIQPGKIGLVIANDGDPMPIQRALCQAVECDNFQDAARF